MYLFRYLTGAVLALSIASAAQATTIFNNLGSQQDPDKSYRATEYEFNAQKFTTDSGSYTMHRLTMRLQEYIPGDMLVDLCGDNGGEPGAVVYNIYNGTTGGAGLTGSFKDITFYNSVSYDLTADSTYWVVLRGNNANDTSGQIECSYDGNGNLPTGIGGSTDAAVYWEDRTGGHWFSNSTPFVMNISTEVVPEPASGAIVLLLMGAASLRMRRRPEAVAEAAPVRRHRRRS